MRFYTLDFSTPGQYQVTPAPVSVKASHAKVGQVTLEWFYKVYGRNPDKQFWQAKGFMAGADDKRGNSLTVTQYNHDMLPGFDTKTKMFQLAKIQPNQSSK